MSVSDNATVTVAKMRETPVVDAVPGFWGGSSNGQ